jgi:3-methyl-2-oxobutanoate hydroxymethyltransferase
MNIVDFQKKKEAKEKIVMVTCYDAPTQAIIEKTEVDCVLVGDTVSVVVHGHDNTTYATMDMMCLHVSAVKRKQKTKFIIGDMPFLSYRGPISETLHNVRRLLEAGAHAVKIEGASGNLETIHQLVESGVPVMGHLGLTPQSFYAFGGHRVQGKTHDAQEKLRRDARALEKSGVFALVLECVPSEVAKMISDELSIPTIGIGAGPDTDGQVLVLHDLLGFDPSFKPKFLKQYMDTEHAFQEALASYAKEVKTHDFPSQAHSY